MVIMAIDMNSSQYLMRTILTANLRHGGGFETRPYKLRDAVENHSIG
jgi:hypothetical protein